MTGSVPAVSGLTVDDLNRLERAWGGIDADMPALLAAARKVEGLRAEVERLRAERVKLTRQWLDATAPERFVKTAADIAAHTTMTPLEVEAMLNRVSRELGLQRQAEAERDAAVLRADTAERRLAAVHAYADALTRQSGEFASEYERATWRAISADVADQVRAAAGPVPVTPVTEDQQTVDDDLSHAEMEELVWMAQATYCQYADGSGDDGNPAFALIRIEGQWKAVCAYHAQAAAAGEMESWLPAEDQS